MKNSDKTDNQEEYPCGQQIVYFPNHVLDTIYGHSDFEAALQHKDTQFGFVTSKHPTQDAYFCRYWYLRSGKGYKDPIELRTTSCSELTPTGNLFKYDSVDQKNVEAWLDKIDAEELHETNLQQE